MEQVFSREGQLSEVNLDPDTLADMVSIMFNKYAYRPSLKDIMDKYYEMFRGRNHPAVPQKKTTSATQVCEVCALNDASHLDLEVGCQVE
jgi:hypothetical protein